MRAKHILFQLSCVLAIGAMIFGTPTLAHASCGAFIPPGHGTHVCGDDWDQGACRIYCETSVVNSCASPDGDGWYWINCG